MKFLMLFSQIFSMYKVVWSNTEINIPLFENVSSYFELPKAKIYKNNKEVKSTDYYYEKGVNRTHLSVVNSNHVKSFKIDYRVTYDDLNVISEQTITFNIIDVTPPEILYIPKFREPVDSKKLTEKQIIEKIKYKDNYYDEKDLIVNVNNLNEVDTKRVGIYNIEIEIIDPSLNITKEITTYEIYNIYYPEIKYSDPIIHNIDETFNHYNYFKYVDKLDNNLKINIDTSKVKFNKIGKYPITVKVTNKDNLSTKITTNIHIVDKSPPNIIIKSNINPINIYTNITREVLEEYILDVVDNYDQLKKEDLKIIHDIDSNKIGKYKIIYKLCDSSNNCTTKEVKVEVKDLLPPCIKQKKSIFVDVGSTKKINYKDYFLIEDNYSTSHELNIIYDDKDVDYNKIGKYSLIVTATDENKNKQIKEFIVKVVDNSAPEIIQKKEVYITNFQKDDDYIISHFEFIDNYYNNDELIIVLEDTKVNYNEKGMYKVEIRVTDPSNNIKKSFFDVYVIDIIEPTIKLKTKEYTYYLNDQVPSLRTFIKEVYDNYDILNESDIQIIENINYSKVGMYDVIYKVSDKSKNKTEEKLIFYVDVKPNKLITGNNIEIKVNDAFNVYEGLKISEEVYKIDYFPEKINTKIPGDKYITYIAYDYRGNSEIFVQKVSIVDESNYKLDDFKPIIIITIGYILIIIIVIIEEKRK